MDMPALNVTWDQSHYSLHKGHCLLYCEHSGKVAKAVCILSVVTIIVAYVDGREAFGA